MTMFAVQLEERGHTSWEVGDSLLPNPTAFQEAGV